MKEHLHITNGGNSVDLMRAAQIQGDKFSWDDVLHEGPVPAVDDLSDLSDIRAKFIADSGYGDYQQVRERFKERDLMLTSAPQYQNVTLWFEHDLYDQLQLIQLLSWFAEHGSGTFQLNLIQTDKFLGHHDPEDIPPLLNISRPVSSEQLATARLAWQAFTSDDPQALNDLIGQDLSALPFLKLAILRLAQEYPDSKTGLPRTEKMILQCLHEESMNGGNLFRQYTELETAQFMGDSTFFNRLKAMVRGKSSSVEMSGDSDDIEPHNQQQKFALTDYGQALLAENGFWFSDNLQRKSIGGCEISVENLWVWDKLKNKIIKKN